TGLNLVLVLGGMTRHGLGNADLDGVGIDAACECQGAQSQGERFHSDKGLHACGSPKVRLSDSSRSDWNSYDNELFALWPAYSPGSLRALSLRVCPRHSPACQENSRESSAARGAAASMAARTVPVKSLSRNTFNAAAVVPPLEVTRSRGVARSSGESAASWVAPVTVAIARRRAVAGAMPCSTAAAIIASRNRKTYAGPLPDNEVTTSMA